MSRWPVNALHSIPVHAIPFSDDHLFQNVGASLRLSNVYSCDSVLEIKSSIEQTRSDSL